MQWLVKWLNILYMSCDLLYVIWKCLIVSWNISCIIDLVYTRLLCVNTFCFRTELRHKWLPFWLQIPCGGATSWKLPQIPRRGDTSRAWHQLPRGGETTPLWHQLSVVGKPFECHIISQLWWNHASDSSRVTSIHVVGTPFVCNIRSTIRKWRC